MNHRVGVIILAAGAGRRFGGPKARAHQDGKSYLAWAAEHLCEAGLPWISIVVGAAAEEVMADTALAAVRSAEQDARGAHPSSGLPLRQAGHISHAGGSLCR